jgi:non-specific serine/threonine protein kinase
VIRLADATSISYSSPSFLEGDADNRFFWPPALSTHEEALFARQGDYWTIRYQGCVAFLKATRGLQCLSLLLQNPGREFHVSELLEQVTGKPRVTTANGNVSRACRGRLAPDTGPILDAQAKSEYKLGLEDLRADLKDAERFCDLGRAEQARREIDALAQQLASAVGLGGRDRKSGSEAERARCAVTKRIKESINKIGQTIPSLRRHLATQIKTGYFCSYNLHAEHRVAWAFQSFLTLLFLAYKVTL